jgi:hypothetical protein
LKFLNSILIILDALQIYNSLAKYFLILSDKIS